MAVTGTFLQSPQLATFISIFSLVTINLNLAEKRRETWDFAGANHFTVFLNNDIWSGETKPIDAIGQSEVFLSFILVSVKVDFIGGCSESWVTTCSAEAR